MKKISINIKKNEVHGNNMHSDVNISQIGSLDSAVKVDWLNVLH